MTRRTVIVALIWLAAAQPAAAQRRVPTFFPEQRSIIVRDPSQLMPSRLPDSLPPSTVSHPQPELQPVSISLDNTIRMSLGNVDVVRILAGAAATNSGRTIYDPAINNTAIDQQHAQFDPTLSVSNTWNRMENPQAVFDPFNPGLSQRQLLLHAAETDTNPKCKRGRNSIPRLRFGLVCYGHKRVSFGREEYQYFHEPHQTECVRWDIRSRLRCDSLATDSRHVPAQPTNALA